MSMSISDATRFINTNVLRHTEANTLPVLRAQQKELQSRLWEVTDAINRQINGESRTMNENLLQALQNQFPFMLFGATAENWHVCFEKTPVAFHKMYRDGDVDNTIYRTLPLYNFSVTIERGLLSIKNTTSLAFSHQTDPCRLYSGVHEDVLYSHPHDSGCDSAHGEAFRGICSGNNGFLTMLDKAPLEPGDVMNFLRSLALWISSVNMDDSYGTSLYRMLAPQPEMHSREVAGIADRQFAWSLRHVAPLLRGPTPPALREAKNVLHDFKSCVLLNPFHLSEEFILLVEHLCHLPDPQPASDGGEAFSATARLLLLLHANYALWLYAVSRRFPDIKLSSNAQNALLTDLDVCLFSNRNTEIWLPDSTDTLEAWRQSLLCCPLTLKRYDPHGRIFSRLEPQSVE